MMIKIVCSLCALLFSPVFFSLSPGNVIISSPDDGQYVTGNFEIKGSASSESFDYAELLYSYENVENETWFSISEISQPVTDAVLASWDTTTISDGDYRIKLVLHEKNGNTEEYVVNHIFVRNYTAVAITPTLAINDMNTPVTAIVPITEENKATPYPTNQAAISINQTEMNLENGAIFGIVGMLALGIFVYFRGWIRRR